MQPPLAAAVSTVVLPWLILCGCNSAQKELGHDPFAQLAEAPLTHLLLPSNHRRWSPDLAVLSYAKTDGDHLTVYNIRNLLYQSDEDYVVNHYDQTFDLRKLQAVDFVVVPFKQLPSLAHTMLSFEFADGQYLGVSVEARLEEGEKYSPLQGALRQYELMYVVADERDLIARRTRFRDVDVYLYRTTATAEQARALLLDVMARVNQLAEQPEFYDTFTNNCTTNIVRHINHIKPGRIPFDPRVLLPGFSDQLAYELGLIEPAGSFQETRRRARVNELANRHLNDPGFSEIIRRKAVLGESQVASAGEKTQE